MASPVTIVRIRSTIARKITDFSHRGSGSPPLCAQLSVQKGVEKGREMLCEGESRKLIYLTAGVLINREP